MTKEKAFKIIQNMQVDYFYRLFDEIHNDEENESYKEYLEHEKRCDEAMELLKPKWTLKNTKDTIILKIINAIDHYVRNFGKKERKNWQK